MKKDIVTAHNSISYKGVKGGDPARRPPKFEVTYPCPKCRASATAVTDFGRPGKHVCHDCRDAVQRGEKCHGCGSRKGKLYYNYEYFEYEQYTIEEEFYFHKHCLVTYKESHRDEWP